jgi:hypothetical protein
MLLASLLPASVSDSEYEYSLPFVEYLIFYYKNVV